ncbi:MAG: hypothetical protein CMQ40_03155 [Gammaproteobacteria bacterium]|nr:hypothetical protein [Gammaproteobacteria bacterium]
MIETELGVARPSVYFEEQFKSLPKLENKTVAITGTTSGTGYVAAETFGRLGARVILLNRPSARADKTLHVLQSIGLPGSFYQVDCDLQSFESVRSSLPKIEALCEQGLDVLCNNAGVMALEDTATVDGFDIQMQTNHLSHFLLTKLVFPFLEKAESLRGEARIVNHSSMARLMVKRLESKYMEKRGGDLGGNGSLMLLFPGGRWIRYGQSKLANAAFTSCLHEKLKIRKSNIKAVVAHPGVADTDLQRTTVKDVGGRSWLNRSFLDMVFRVYIKMGQSKEDGALGIIKSMADPVVRSGEFIGPGMTMAAMKGPALSYPLEGYYDNVETRELLWTKSCEAIEDDFVI